MMAQGPNTMPNMGAPAMHSQMGNLLAPTMGGGNAMTQPGPMQGMQPGLTGGMMGQQPMYNDLMQPAGTSMNNMTMPQAGQAPTPTPDVQQLFADRAAMRANPNAQRAAQMRGAELMRNRRF